MKKHTIPAIIAAVVFYCILLFVILSSFRSVASPMVLITTSLLLMANIVPQIDMSRILGHPMRCSTADNVPCTIETDLTHIGAGFWMLLVVCQAKFTEKLENVVPAQDFIKGMKHILTGQIQVTLIGRKSDFVKVQDSIGMQGYWFMRNLDLSDAEVDTLTVLKERIEELESAQSRRQTKLQLTLAAHHNEIRFNTATASGAALKEAKVIRELGAAFSAGDREAAMRIMKTMNVRGKQNEE